MGRRYPTRGISRDRVYTCQQAARVVGVSEATFRKWPQRGLQIIKDQRPYLVRGHDLIDYLEAEAKRGKSAMGPAQFLCGRCKVPRDAFGGMADYQPYTVHTGRLSALCAECEAPCGRFCGVAQLADLRAFLDIAIKEPPQA